MRVAISQSNYLPWKGYFDLINDVDHFIFLDSVQFTKRDWRHRNRIKFHSGTRWIRASVKEDTSKEINEIEFKNKDWQRENWELINQAYRKAPHYEWIQPLLSEVLIEREWTTLSELNQFLVKKISKDYLGINTQFSESKDYNVESKKQELIIDLVKASKATEYLSGPLAKAYIDEARFKEMGVSLLWKDYSGYPEYSQSWPPFEHAVSIIDVLAHLGPQAPDHIWGWRQKGEE